MKKLYVYALTCDSGFAPCFDDGLFTLACCKGGKNGGMRKSVHNSLNDGDEVYLLGVCSKSLARDANSLLCDEVDRAYRPIFFARIGKTVEYKDYYSDDSEYNGRNDQKAYSFKNGEPIPNTSGKNPHAGYPDLIEKDINGRYVLISDDYAYLGSNCGKIEETSIEKECPYIFKTDSTSGKSGIDKHPRGYIIYDHIDFNLDKYLSELKEISEHSPVPVHLSERFIADDSDDENDFAVCSCGGKR